MNPELQRLQHVLRELRLLRLVEGLRFWMSIARCSRRNAQFIRRNPDFVLPPRHLAYDAYSAPDWTYYKNSGEETAMFLADIIRTHSGNSNEARVLEWGCGPGRVIRHMPETLGQKTGINGADYNKESIQWCREHLNGINFVTNGLAPPLPFEDNAFDAVYAISVFTHLSESLNFKWVAELVRAMAPGGILILSLNGLSQRDILLPEERRLLDSVGLVVRDKTQEGKKMFGAFHSPDFVRNKLLAGMKIVRHDPGGFPCLSQDLWIARKSL